MERGTRVFLPPSFRDVEWHNLVAIAVVHRIAEIVRLRSREIISRSTLGEPSYFYTYVFSERNESTLLPLVALSKVICVSDFVSDK